MRARARARARAADPIDDAHELLAARPVPLVLEALARVRAWARVWARARARVVVRVRVRGCACTR